ncbi:DUF397 domain-containing protein [Streptomyces olivaceus]|uniref:DUF397 domain-containing protein n=1 Tax=Streptomyces olivaceus TaxID=47716 RepID=UPI00332E4E77
MTAHTRWLKSSYSGGEGNECVEVASPELSRSPGGHASRYREPTPQKGRLSHGPRPGRLRSAPSSLHAYHR